ncbi:MAG: radical SAM family heme chaperone HemW [Planctomycetota bacterium]|nr:radical SAM family heme chaperone HemW [Planctomycetota bacterium]
MDGASTSADVVDVLAVTEGAPRIPHLYVHWPFCARKCPYCDFNSHAGRDAEHGRYAAALIEEARRWRGRVDARTVFVGGGTPTHVDAEGLERYLGGIAEALGFDAVEEWTIEANPGSLDRAKVRALRRVGVNRTSLGVQSFDDRHLKTLGRVHEASDAVRGIEILREGDMPRFSLDLILATPGQTLADQERDLQRAVDLEPEHVSAYVLTFEEGTAFTDLMRQGRMPAPDPDRELDHLHLACERLAAAGLARYEISNFARPGAESRHNLAYWRNADWIGIGAGAHSHVQGRRWANVADPAAYAGRIEAGALPTAWDEHVDAPNRALEFVLMGLRLTEGLDLATVEAATGIRYETTHKEELDELLRHGLVALEGRRLRLVGRGFDLANTVIQRLRPRTSA